MHLAPIDLNDFDDFLAAAENPYICDQCGRSFRQSGNLNKHVKSHDNAHLVISLIENLLSLHSHHGFYDRDGIGRQI